MINTLEIVKGSIADIAQTSGKSIAQVFAGAKVVAIVDTSGSMSWDDARGGRTRYEVACEELEAIQKNNPGEVAVISFSDDAMFCPGGIPFYYGRGTDLANALRYSKIADLPNMQIVVISDGEPDNEIEALTVAKTYKNKISTIYVGPERERFGRSFLSKLANATGGQHMTSDRATDLGKKIETLMLSAG